MKIAHYFLRGALFGALIGFIYSFLSVSTFDPGTVMINILLKTSCAAFLGMWILPLVMRGYRRRQDREGQPRESS